MYHLSRRQTSRRRLRYTAVGTNLHEAGFIGPLQSHRYRALFLNRQQAITRIATFAAFDDEQAAEMMLDMVDGATELWDRSRFIQRYPGA
jgi:hypothetical protein